MKVSLFLCWILFAGVALAQKTIYVNNIDGSDANSGSSPIAGSNGPKLTIAAALLLATTGDTISIAATPSLYTDSVTISKQVVFQSTGGTPEVTGFHVALAASSGSITVAGPFRLRTLNLQEGKVQGSDKLTMVAGGSVFRRSPTAMVLQQLDFEGKVDLEYAGEKDMTMGLETPTAMGGEIDILGLNFSLVSHVPRLTIPRSIAVQFVRFVHGLLITDTNYVEINNPAGTADGGFTRALQQQARSHVVGNVRKTLKASSLTVFGRNEFPVGDTTFYRPAVITFFNPAFPADTSLRVSATVSHTNQRPTGVVGLPISKGIDANTDLAFFAGFYWSISTTGTVGSTPYNLELTAEGVSASEIDLVDVSSNRVKIIRRLGTPIDTSNPWSLAGSNHDNFVIGGVPTLVTVGAVGGLITGGAMFTYGLKGHVAPSNNLPSTINLTSGCHYFVRDLTNPPAFTGNIGKLIYSAFSSNPNIALASVRNDSLVIEGRIQASTTVTLTATDSYDGSRISYSLPVQSSVTYLPDPVGAPRLTLDAKQMQFGVVSINQEKRLSVKLSNSSSDPRAVLSVSALYSSDSSFVINWSPRLVYPCYPLDVAIAFKPYREGAIDAQLIILSNSSTSPDTVQLSGNGVTTSITEQQSPSFNVHLSQNYPNPFNPTTTIEFSIRKQSFVELNIFNTLGMEIVVLLKQYLPPGHYRTRWTARDIPSGVYFYQLRSPEFNDTKKLLLLR